MSVEASNDVKLLLPAVADGPFVMNTREQIAQAVNDLSSGRFG